MSNTSWSFQKNIGKIIIVTLRLPIQFKRSPEGRLERVNDFGGLTSSVTPFIVFNGGKWVGYPGHLQVSKESIPEALPDDNSITANLSREQLVPVTMGQEDFDIFYSGCCKKTLWPLFHCMPDLADFSSDEWKKYISTNEVYAQNAIQAINSLINDGEKSRTILIWIHDYHLMLVGNMIRMANKHQLKLKLGFFLHSPFPPWDLLKILPWADEVLEGILGCDMVGFHVQDYCLNFIDCCQRRLGCRVDREKMFVESGKRTVRIIPMPIGIPFERLQKLAYTAPNILSADHTFVLAVDVLDYTKGIVNRLLAFEAFLEKYPQYKMKVVLLQIAYPSSCRSNVFSGLKEEIDQQIGRINGKFTTPSWYPIHYIYGNVSEETLCSFFRDADVALITPLRDGMNLVAKDFVACQIKKSPGVLVVSRFAGTAVTMKEALKCNPFEIEGAADLIYKALTMPEDERVMRMNLLRSREMKQDSYHWIKSFLLNMGEMIENVDEYQLQLSNAHMRPLTVEDFDEILSKLMKQTKKLAILLNYDGALTTYTEDRKLTVLPDETRKVLQKLSQMNEVYICIISCRTVKNLQELVSIEGLTYAGNHGLEVLYPDGSRFSYSDTSQFEGRTKLLVEKLRKQVCREGAWVEEKGIFLTFCFGHVPENLQSQLVTEAKKLIEDDGYIAEEYGETIKAKPPIDWSKGKASICILRTVFGLDWSERIRIIYVGDSNSDEDAFMTLKGMGATFRVTEVSSLKTAAELRLSSKEAVLILLMWIERYISREKEHQKV